MPHRVPLELLKEIREQVASGDWQYDADDMLSILDDLIERRE